MGNYINKFFSHNNEICENEFEKEEIENPSPTAEATVEKDIMQTPPIIHKTLPTDPRSVTSGINRTPIEVNSTPVGVNKRVLSAIPRHLQTKPYLETDMDKIMLCLTPKKRDVTEIPETQKLHFPDMQTKNAEIFLTPTINNRSNKKVLSAIDNERYNILGLDPRSPAADFDRTPILMPKSLERLKARSQENLHRRGSYDTDIFYPRFSYCEMSSQFNVTEIEALPDFTNDDKFNEPESPCSSHSPKSDSDSEIGERELEDENEDENERTLEEDSCDDICVNEKIEQKEMCADNDIIKVWRDSLVLDEPQESEANDLNDAQVVQKRLSHIGKEEVIITFDDESIIEDALSLKLAKSERQHEKAKVDAIGRKKKMVKSEVKVALDEKKVFCPNDKNGNESAKIRTPLGNRSNNGQMKTLLNSPQQIFRSKGITPKMLQENTPPHKKFVAKPKLSSTQWDPDSTVII